jgi:hypothetical protein
MVRGTFSTYADKNALSLLDEGAPHGQAAGVQLEETNV